MQGMSICTPAWPDGRALVCVQAYVLLNCDDHGHFLKKHKKDPAYYRPDICHQVGFPLQGDEQAPRHAQLSASAEAPAACCAHRLCCPSWTARSTRPAS